MVDGKFTAKERAYLASLPAVESVSASHIRYADSFRIEVMCRYNAGESPAAIFREAGLDPKLIGYKRIERCIARWKKQEERDRRNSKRDFRWKVAFRRSKRRLTLPTKCVNDVTLAAKRWRCVRLRRC